MLGGPTEGAVKANWPLAILASVAIHVVFVGALLFFSSSGDTAPAKTQETSAQPSEPTPGPAVEQEPDPAPPPVQPAQSSPRASRGTRGSNGGRSSGGTRNAGAHVLRAFHAVHAPRERRRQHRGGEAGPRRSACQCADACRHRGHSARARTSDGIRGRVLHGAAG